MVQLPTYIAGTPGSIPGLGLFYSLKFVINYYILYNIKYSNTSLHSISKLFHLSSSAASLLAILV